jgi:anti-sigma-K factor RskA
MSTTDHETTEALVAEHALGTLATGDRAEVEAHLVACAACRLLFDEVAAASAEVELALAACAVVDHVPVPTPDAERDLLRAVRAAPRDRVPAPRRRPRRAWMVGGGALVAAACSSLLVLAVVASDRQERIDSLERRLKDARGDQVAVLRGASISDLDASGPFGTARGQVVLQRDAGMVAFRDVPAPPEDMVWQVWTIDADQRISSIGVIDAARKAAILPIGNVDPDDIERIIVNTQPAGGSDEPTADEVAETTV